MVSATCIVFFIYDDGAQVQTRSMRLSGEIDFAGVSKATPGFVGADLAALVKESAALAVKRCFQALPLPPVGAAGPDAGAPANADPLARSQAWSQRARERTPLSVAELGGLAITMADFQEAVGKVPTRLPLAAPKSSKQTCICVCVMMTTMLIVCARSDTATRHNNLIHKPSNRSGAQKRTKGDHKGQGEQPCVVYHYSQVCVCACAGVYLCIYMAAVLINHATVPGITADKCLPLPSNSR